MAPLSVREVGAGETVILVHGTLTDGTLTWPKQASLAERYRLLVVDRRGYGESPETHGEDWDNDAADLIEILDGLDEPAHIVTHSYGGLGAMVAAVARPEKVLSLTLIEPPAVSLVGDHPDAIAVDEAIRSSKQNPELVMASHEAMEEWVFGFLGQAGVDTSRIRRPLAPGVVKAGKVLFFGRSAGEYIPPLDELRALPFPKLVITGNHRPYYEAIGDILEERLDADRIVLEGRGHAIPLLGEPFNEVLVRFLELASAARRAA